MRAGSSDYKGFGACERSIPGRPTLNETFNIFPRGSQVLTNRYIIASILTGNDGLAIFGNTVALRQFAVKEAMNLADQLGREQLTWGSRVHRLFELFLGLHVRDRETLFLR